MGPGASPLDRGADATRVFLVADIRGYTAYTTRLGDVAASRLAQRFAGIMAEGVAAWAGRLVELRGDEALAVFDRPEAALAAAVELQDAFGHESAAHPGHPLPVGMGLDIGEAVPVGAGYRGRALNLAARLCGVSRAGEVHASLELMRRADAPPGVELELVEQLELKGFGSNRQAWRLDLAGLSCPDEGAEATAAQEPTPVLPAELVSEHPLVGREAEMCWLGWHWRRARQGHGRAVRVRGAAGVGKTRLVAQLASSALTDGARIGYRPPSDGRPLASLLAGAAGGRPGVVIVDGVEEDEPVLPVVQDIRGDAVLVVLVGRSPDGNAGRSVGDAVSPPWPTLEVAPLGLEGLRELAASVAPDVVDELPLGRILAQTHGLPARAREAISEWAARVEAERSAAKAEPLAPAEGSSFVGRSQELAATEELLRKTRLLTLVGPPGTGKTRLALRLFRECGSRYPGGCWFVPLQAVRDPGLVASAVARALGLRESPDAAPLDVAKAYLSEREALVVLDNFEQLLEAAPDVSKLLGSAPQLTVLVTSRSSLGIPGEQLFPVPPMALPPPGADVDVARMEAYDAVALFCARSRAVDPDFALDAANAEPVSRIAARLEGLPLAIELAAARVRTLAPAELLEHLDRRLPVLTAGGSVQEERHRTMRDAIAWSYELLPGDDQALLRLLAVFRGGFTLRLATQLATRPELETIDGLAALVSHSLLTRAPADGRTRFSMLELVREYAVDELTERQELADATARHAQVLLALAEETGPAMEGDGATEALARLTPEVDNIRAALEHALTAGDAALGLRLGATVWRLWQSIGQLSEGREWLERCLDLDGGSDLDRANAHGAIAGLAYWLGDFAAAKEHYTAARELFHEAGDAVEEANARYCLSLVATLQGELEVAEQQVDQALDVFRELDLEGNVGEALMAKTTVAWRKGELELARDLAERTVAISLRLGNRAAAASQILGLAGVAFQQQDVATAVAKAAQSLEMAIETNNTHTQIFALDSIASFTVADAPFDALRLCSAASTLREEHGGGWTLTAFGIDCARDAAVGRLSDERIAEAWEEGSSLGLDEAITIGRALIEGWSTAASG